MAVHASSVFVMDRDNYLSCLANSADFQLLVESAESTTFCSGGAKERIPTLSAEQVTVSTFINESTLNGTYMSGSPTGGWMILNYRAPQAGDTFHAMPSLAENSPAIGGDVSGLLQADMSFVNETSYIIRGQGASTGGVLQWTTATSSGSGSGVDFGALSAGDTLYAWLAVDRATVSGTTPTLDVTIQRSATDSWGAPTTVYTFAQATASANTHQKLSTVTGAQAETWYRAAYTVGGTGTPTFRFFVGIGVTTLA